MAIPPSIPAVANDLGERCQVAIGPAGQEVGYVFENGSKVKFTPQKARSEDATYISSSDFLTMRDWDYWSRVFVNDWRRGFGQIVVDPTTSTSKQRFWDSTSMDISSQGQLTLLKSYASMYSITSTGGQYPLEIAGAFLYLGDINSIKYSSSWSGAPSSANTSANGTVMDLVADAQYVYGGVNGVGINRWTIGSTTAGTLATSIGTVFRRLLWANRKLYGINTDTVGGIAPIFYEFNTAAAVPWTLGAGATADLSLPLGWSFSDIEALRGGTIEAPVTIAGYQGQQSMLWYWDGSAIHDYMSLPSGFIAARLKQYLGVLYILGIQYNPDGLTSACVYAIANNTLSFVGYLGLPQAGGDPGPHAGTNLARFATDASANFVYFGWPALAPGADTEVWRYDVVNGGLSRFVKVTNNSLLGDIRIWQGLPWITIDPASPPNPGLYAAQTTFASTGTLDTSDMYLGQPWAANLWTIIEISHSPLTTGQSIAISYSLDQGGTYTSAGTNSTVGSSGTSFTISTATTSVKGLYIRLRITLNAGATNTTTPKFYSATLKAAPQDVGGVVMECTLTCPDKMLMPNGSPDWQGLSGQERIYNITNAFQNQNIVNLIYLAPSATRPKNPVTVPVKIVDYELLEPSSVNVDPNFGVQGSIRVVMRQAI